MNELDKLSTLIKDASSHRVEKFATEAFAAKADDIARNAFAEILDGELNWQSWRNHKNEIFTVMEDVLKTELPNAWNASPFYQRCCEVKNGAVGDKNSFAIQDNSYLLAAKFSGGTWDVERQKLGRAKNISIDTDWSYIDLYEDFDRFLKGYTTLVDLISAAQKALSVDMDNRIGTVFNGLGAYLPAQFVESGSYDADTMADLITRVQVANQKPAILVGSQRALTTVANGIPTAWISDAAKEERATTGLVLNNTGLGIQGVIIPQTFVPFTYDFAIADNTIFVLPDEQLIKVYYEGDVRARERTEQETHDQTIDVCFQHKVGVELVTSSLFGKYTVE